MEHEIDKDMESDQINNNKPGLQMGKYSDNQKFKHAIKGVLALVIVVIIFFAGMVVGRIQGRFSYNHISRVSMMNQGELNNNSMMNTPRAYNTPGILGQGNQETMPNSNGIKGTITSVGNNQIVVKGDNGVSENITITAETIIKNQTQDLKISDLKSGQNVTIIGDPDSQGGISAKFIGIEK
jgi:hypothetical protein